MLRRILTIIGKVEMALAMLCLSCFTIIVFLGAVTRYFKHPLMWSSDLALFLFAWTTFLGGDIAYRSGRLVNVNVIVAYFPLALQKLTAVIIYGIILTFLGCLIIYGIKLCGTTIHRTFNGIPGFSYVWVTISIPICCGFMAITSIDRLVRLLRSQDRAEVAKM
ncbi:MAG: TRAP transporter small permease [Planctomycetes bacterium]|nr:TRAP transporter small permease [Planctomycetota bacterium]